MEDTYEHIAILVPDGVPFGEATETRTCTLEIDAAATETEQHEAVAEYIQKSREIDSWAFRKYWDIGHIARIDGSEVDQIRELLKGCTYPTHPRNDTAVPYTVYFQEQGTGRWKPSTLTVPTALRARVRGWTSDFRQSHEIDAKPGEIHAAMIRAVATVQDEFPSTFAENPRKAQEKFIKTAITNEQAVLEAIRE